MSKNRISKSPFAKRAPTLAFWMRLAFPRKRLAVEAVISEPVSPPSFPVRRESTAKFANFDLTIEYNVHLPDGNSIAYQQNSLHGETGKMSG